MDGKELVLLLPLLQLFSTEGGMDAAKKAVA
jgi:hypothetical protein